MSFGEDQSNCSAEKDQSWARLMQRSGGRTLLPAAAGDSSLDQDGDGGASGDKWMYLIIIRK